MLLFLGRSKAGHDKNKVFVIVEEDNDYYYLVDGKGRTLDKPKKKKKKHIQPIFRFPQGMERELVSPDDSSIRKVIREYENRKDA